MNKLQKIEKMLKKASREEIKQLIEDKVKYNFKAAVKRVERRRLENEQ